MSQVTYQPEERAHKYRQLSDQAIKLALRSQWEEAVDINRELLSEFPRDLSALNRLGKALSELGRYGEAKQAYADALEVDPSNGIARKNFERLSQLKDAAASGSRHPAGRVDSRLFIEETGKTTFTTLVDLAPRDVLAQLSAGDQVYLKQEGNSLVVTSASDKRIGLIEPRLARRVLTFMKGGNKYAAGITELGDGEVRIIIRETFQDPSQLGKVSFPATHAGGEVVRPYIKDTILRHDMDEEEEFEEGEYAEEADEEEGEDLGQEDEFRENDFMDSEG